MVHWKEEGKNIHPACESYNISIDIHVTCSLLHLNILSLKMFISIVYKYFPKYHRGRVGVTLMSGFFFFFFVALPEFQNCGKYNENA